MKKMFIKSIFLIFMLLLLTACEQNLNTRDSLDSIDTASRLDLEEINCEDIFGLIGSEKFSIINVLGDEYKTIATNFSGSIEEIGIIYNMTIYDIPDANDENTSKQDIPVSIIFEHDGTNIIKIIITAQDMAASFLMTDITNFFEEREITGTELTPLEGTSWNYKQNHIRIINTGNLVQLTVERSEIQQN